MGDVLDTMMSTELNNKKKVASAAMNTATPDTTVPNPTIGGYNDEFAGQSMNLFKEAQGMDYEGSQYDNKVSDLLSGIEGSSYESSYDQDIADLINGIQSSEFNYDPETDETFQTAKDISQRQVFEEMGSRGILTSTVTADRVASATSELVGQFKDLAYQEYRGTQEDKFTLVNTLSMLDQVAYSKFQDKLSTDFKLADYYNNLSQQDYAKFTDEVNNLYSQAEYINQLDTKEYTKYQDAIDNEYNQAVFDFEKDQTEIYNQRQEIADAWTRVEEIGYVDNEASIILGVESGTLSRSAREAKEALDNQLALLDRQLQNQYAVLEKEYAQQEALLSLQGESLTVSDAWNNATPAQKANYDSVKSILLDPNNRSTGGDPTAALTWLSQPDKQALLEQQLGTELGTVLVSELSNMAGTQTETTVDPMSDYTTVYNEAKSFLGSSMEGRAYSVIANSTMTQAEKDRAIAQLGVDENSGNQTVDLTDQNQATTQVVQWLTAGKSIDEINAEITSYGWEVVEEDDGPHLVSIGGE